MVRDALQCPWLSRVYEFRLKRSNTGFFVVLPFASTQAQFPYQALETKPAVPQLSQHFEPDVRTRSCSSLVETLQLRPSPMAPKKKPKIRPTKAEKAEHTLLDSIYISCYEGFAIIKKYFLNSTIMYVL